MRKEKKERKKEREKRKKKRKREKKESSFFFVSIEEAQNRRRCCRAPISVNVKLKPILKPFDTLILWKVFFHHSVIFWIPYFHCVQIALFLHRKPPSHVAKIDVENQAEIFDTFGDDKAISQVVAVIIVFVGV